MRYSFLINSLQGGGTEKVCKLLANELAKKGHEIDIYILDKKNDIFVPVNNVNLFYLGKKSTTKSIPVFFKLIPKIKTSSILVFNHELALSLLFVKSILKSDLLIVSRMNNTFSITIKFKSLLYRVIMQFLMKSFYKYIDYYIYQSKGIQEDLEYNYHVSGPSSLIPNPIIINENKIQKKTNSNNNLLYVGRLVKQKNVYDILYVFYELSKKYDELTLTLVGDGLEREALEDYCINKKLTKKVKFVGKVSDVSHFYSSASITLLTSFNEGFPNVLLESIAHGTPVVSYDCPSGPSEIVIDGINGFLVQHLNKEELKSSILKSLQFDWDSSLLVNSIEKFKSESIVSEYEKVLNYNESSL